METTEQLLKYYQEEAKRLKININRLKARGRGFVVGEIAFFLGILFFLVLITLSESTGMKVAEGVGAALMAVAYIIVRNRDVKNSEQITRLEQLYKAYANEAEALQGRFAAFDDGQRYVDPHHPFTYDLDVFGPGSLYQRINRTATTGGADALSHFLSFFSPLNTETFQTEKLHTTPQSTAKAYHSPPFGGGEGGEAGDASAASFFMSFISHGVDKKIDTDVVLESLPQLRKIAIPEMFRRKGIKLLAWALSIGLWASIIAAIYGYVNFMLPIVWMFANFFIVQGVGSKYLCQMLEVGDKLQSQMQPLMKLVKLVISDDGRALPHGPYPLQQEVERLKAAETSFEKLTYIVESLVLRGHGAYKFFADAFGLRGLLLVARFYQWRTIASDKLPEWIAALTEIDARISMLQFRLDHPEAADATIIDNNSVYYSARSLYHPFLGKKAVPNDFTIVDRNFYIITGANMAGKSTFLRAIGVNYILAMNAMPVFARSLTVTRFHIFTSMRTSDDLTHGISYFNAELLRLKQLIKSLSPFPSPEGRGVECSANDKQTLPTLVILDEILKGTNSLDKLNGSRMFLRAMEKEPVTGIVATHDLELSKMADESPRFHNYCFEIELGTDVTYSYKITPGVARNQNATFLLKKLLEEQKSGQKEE